MCSFNSSRRVTNSLNYDVIFISYTFISDRKSPSLMHVNIGNIVVLNHMLVLSLPKYQKGENSLSLFLSTKNYNPISKFNFSSHDTRSQDLKTNKYFLKILHSLNLKTWNLKRWNKTIFYTVLNIKYIPLVKALQVTGKLKENQRYKP